MADASAEDDVEVPAAGEEGDNNCDKTSPSVNATNSELGAAEQNSSPSDINREVVSMETEEEESTTNNCDTSSSEPESDDLSLEEKRAQSYQNSTSSTAGSSTGSTDSSASSSSTECDNNNRKGAPCSLDNLEPVGSSINSPFIEDIHSPESFTSFMFWREPLPEIPDQDIQRISSPDKEEAPALGEESKEATAAAAAADAREGEGEEADVTDITLQLKSADLLSSEGEAEEMVANIGSEHVLGQLVGETTLAIHNGVVQGICHGFHILLPDHFLSLCLRSCCRRCGQLRCFGILPC